MKKVHLVYIDDYGGTFSPLLLNAVYHEDQEEAAWAHAKKNSAWSLRRNILEL